jgi:uncharacterized protein
MADLHSDTTGVDDAHDAAAGPGTDGPSPPADAPPDQAHRRPGTGDVQPLDPRRISLDRTVSAIVGLVIAMIHLMALALLWLTGAWPPWALLLLALAWPANLLLLVWLAVRWPEIDYRHWRYQVDDTGIQIWSGVIWREAVAVPRSRVQHIDVSQGPLERSYGLATLSIYTAGTRYSKVDLPGLDHAVALALRDGLLPKDAAPAV